MDITHSRLYPLSARSAGRGQRAEGRGMTVFFDTSHADSVVRLADDEALPTLQSREYKGGGTIVTFF